MAILCWHANKCVIAIRPPKLRSCERIQVFRFNEKIETSTRMNETFRNNVHVLRRKLTLTGTRLGYQRRFCTIVEITRSI